MDCCVCSNKMRRWSSVFVRTGTYWCCPQCHLIWDDSHQRSPLKKGLAPFFDLTPHDYTAHDVRQTKSALGVPSYLRHIHPYLPASPERGSDPFSKPLFLELGGGYGHFCQILKEQHDFLPTLVEPGDIGRRYAEKHFDLPTYPDVHSLQQSTQNTFDLIFSGHVWEHVDDPQQFLNESADLLKPGGLWIAITPNADSWKSRLFRGGWCWLSSDHYQIISPASARIMVENAGLEIVTIKDTRPASYHYPGVLIGWVAFLKEWLKSRIIKSFPHQTKNVKPNTPGAPKSDVNVKNETSTLTTRIFVLLGFIAKIERVILFPIDALFGFDELLIVARKKEN